MPTDLSRNARTSLDREYTYMAYGMIGGAVPGIVAGFGVAAFLGHAAMWLSVFGGLGIVLGLVTGILLHRRHRTAEQVTAQQTTARRGSGAARE